MPASAMQSIGRSTRSRGRQPTDGEATAGSCRPCSDPAAVIDAEGTSSTTTARAQSCSGRRGRPQHTDRNSSSADEQETAVPSELNRDDSLSDLASDAEGEEVRVTAARGWAEAPTPRTRQGPRWADILSEDEGSEPEAEPSSGSQAQAAPQRAPRRRQQRRQTAAHSSQQEGAQGSDYADWAGEGASWGGSWTSTWRGSDARAQRWQERHAHSQGYHERGYPGRWATAWTPEVQGAKSRRGYGAASHKKFQCQFIIGIEEDRNFRVVRRVLGPHGQHMRNIAMEAGAKLRLRGMGSGFVEGVEQQESTDPLMLCISAEGSAAYEGAVRQVRSLLEKVYADYRTYCAKSGLPRPTVGIQVHKGARDGAW
mmetsp:Transcript_9262/g.20599  ORF Transcript_9262/g.20599 Transcript_9262/m.20599 type:complete len:369 (+) Transcript_9262:80-1186(+)